MSIRPYIRIMAVVGVTAAVAVGLAAAGAGAVRDDAAQTKVVVRNETYSSLNVFLSTGPGQERLLGQAPPEFTNTLFVEEPLPTRPARLLARLQGEDDVLYSSAPVRLAPGTTLRWSLPGNRVDP